MHSLWSGISIFFVKYIISSSNKLPLLTATGDVLFFRRCRMPHLRHRPPTQTVQFLKLRPQPRRRPISSSRVPAGPSRGVDGRCGWRRSMHAGSKCHTRWLCITTRGRPSASCARNCSRVSSDRVYSVKVGSNSSNNNKKSKSKVSLYFNAL